MNGASIACAALWHTSMFRRNCPESAALLAFRPETARPLGDLADALLHAPGMLSPGEREIIAAYVSRLNDCTFCHNSHAAIAACHLDDEQLVASVMQMPERAAISEKLKALLAVAAKVQQGGRAVRSARTSIARARAKARPTRRSTTRC